jgi:general secretion pathway protein G
MRDPIRVLKPRRPGEAGFSLLEILIAVMILVLMGGVVMTNLFPHFFKAKRSKAELDIGNIKNAVNTYRLQHKQNRIPETSEFPHVLTERGPNGEDPLLDPDTLDGGKLLDPWGNEYQYNRITNSTFEIISYGDDGAPGGEGDAADISSKKSDVDNGSGRRPR